jgi:putative endonuclease
METFFVYILESEETGRLYIGQTNNLEDRLVRHNSNRVRSTKGKGPWKLLGYFSRENRSEAVLLERYLKSLKKPAAVREYLKQHNAL